MEHIRKIEAEPKKQWISLTGYRTLFVLKLLMEKDRSLAEIIEELKKNPIINKSISRDTVVLTLNTLKNAGCKIARPTKKTDSKYRLLSHPFVFKLSKDEFDIMLKLRKNVCRNLSWKDVVIVNEAYEKIFSLTFNDEQISQVFGSKLFPQLKKDIAYKLSEKKLIGRKVKIVYFSPRHGDEVIDVIIRKVIYTEEHLYLSCYNLKYQSNSLLNIERIKDIISISLAEDIEQISSYEVVYELSGTSLCDFEKEDFETILEEKEHSLIIKANVLNEFCFIQRLLLFGSDFKIISPDFFKDKLINKIKLIQKGYENE